MSASTDRAGTPPSGPGGRGRPAFFRGADRPGSWEDSPPEVPGAEAARNQVSSPASQPAVTAEMPPMEQRSDAPNGPPTTLSGLPITPIGRRAPTDDSVASIGRGGKRCGQGRMDPG